MKILKNKKVILNLIITIVSILPFFILIAKLMDLGNNPAAPSYNFYHFLANNNSALGGNLPYFLLIILNFVGILYVTIMSLIKPSNKKSLQNLIIFIILIVFNIAILILSFFIGQINSIELLTTVTPTMVAMIALLNVMFIGCRIALEIIFVEK
jgi:hypothetical protein